MRALKMILMFMLLGIAALAIFLPLSWLRALDSLPAPIENRYDIELQLRQSIESERNAFEARRPKEVRQPVAWPTPDFATLPKDLVALYVNEQGCPNYFGTPMEEGWAWKKRLWNSLLNQGVAGNGGCELNISRSIAFLLGAKTTMEYAAVADRVHRFLKKEDLVAFDLETMHFGKGIIGVHAASRELMQKELNELTLAEMAEMYIALPPYDFWDEIRLCSNAAMIRTNRDSLLSSLRKEGLITPEAEKAANAAPPRCLSVKR